MSGWGLGLTILLTLTAVHSSLAPTKQTLYPFEGQLAREYAACTAGPRTHQGLRFAGMLQSAVVHVKLDRMLTVIRSRQFNKCKSQEQRAGASEKDKDQTCKRRATERACLDNTLPGRQVADVATIILVQYRQNPLQVPSTDTSGQARAFVHRCVLTFRIK